jgi:hypothetical protein
MLSAFANPASTSSLLFIDTAVPDYRTLLQEVTPDTEVYLLDATQDAITQITQTLSDRGGIASLHIVSHGCRVGCNWETTGSP